MYKRQNQDTIQKALEKTGFANDEAFCKDFSKYANIVIVGKKNMQERAALNINCHSLVLVIGWHRSISSFIFKAALSCIFFLPTKMCIRDRTWAAQGVRRPVGPSSTDHAGNLPGLVYDYTQSISAGDPVNMPDNPKQIYPFGPNRRETL